MIRFASDGLLVNSFRSLLSVSSMLRNFAHASRAGTVKRDPPRRLLLALTSLLESYADITDLVIGSAFFKRLPIARRIW